LGFGEFKKSAPLGPGAGYSEVLTRGGPDGGGLIPWIDLGYKPKEVGRLKVEARLVSEGCGFKTANVVGGGF
jgi:hypothetical protein